AAVCARLGLRAVLALKGAQPAEYDGNLLLDRLLGADIRYCTDAEWAKIDETLHDIAARERAQGRTPYIIPESGATVVGALGYLACGQEVAQQVRHGAPEFDTIAITDFSGGSQAGLLMAKQLTGLRAEIVGVPIAWEAARVRAYVTDVIERARSRFGLAVRPPAEVRLRDGLALNYLVEGRGPAVVLVHGLGGFAESWRHNVPSLAARATVYAVDLPGFGRSGKPSAGYSLAYFTRALYAFLDAVGVTQVSLVGHSLGAAVAVTYALTHPARVERLALLSGCVPGFGWRPGWRARLMTTPGVGEALALCGCARPY